MDEPPSATVTSKQGRQSLTTMPGNWKVENIKIQLEVISNNYICKMVINNITNHGVTTEYVYMYVHMCALYIYIYKLISIHNQGWLPQPKEKV